MFFFFNMGKGLYRGYISLGLGISSSEFNI